MFVGLKMVICLRFKIREFKLWIEIGKLNLVLYFLRMLECICVNLMKENYILFNLIFF